MKKIVYINGYKGQNSKKAKLFKEKLNAIHIVLNDQFNTIEVCEQLNLIKPDIIIASSTGCYVADCCEYDDGIFVYLNPLIDLDDLAKLTDVSSLRELTRKDKNTIVLVNEDDELLDYKKAIKMYNNIKIFKYGGHRFKNIEDLMKVILELIKE